MEDRVDLGRVSERSSLMLRSNSKVAGAKRNSEGIGDGDDGCRKRVKMRDLGSVFQSEEMNISDNFRSKEVEKRFEFDGEDRSLVTEVPVVLGLEALQEEIVGESKSGNTVGVGHDQLDLVSNVCVADRPAGDGNDLVKGESSDKLVCLVEKNTKEDNNCGSSIRLGLDLNAEDVASSVNQDVICTQKSTNRVKLRDASECVSSSGPAEVKDSMKLWKEMKQNGFLSSSHGDIMGQSSFVPSSHAGVPPVPKQRPKKSKSEALKKKIEIAKKENVDRFTKVAAPSGLLNELNPGIINNVRNRKQVYSIIEAIVRSEKNEGYHSGFRNLNEPEIDEDKQVDSHEDKLLNPSSGRVLIREHSMPKSKSYHPISDDKIIDEDSSMADYEDDGLALKLSSSSKAFENASSLSNEESTNLSNASSLSVKAARVASQWLELLHQDIKGRLSALRRSKKRVRAVITTELPFLIAKEFSSGQDSDLDPMRNSADGLSKIPNAQMHRQRWSALFDQLDRSLCEEEKQLENWLNQVREMQVHCDQGLQYVTGNTSYGFQHPGSSECDLRSPRMDSSERELAVRASAASIYSTCAFLASKENVSCC